MGWEVGEVSFELACSFLSANEHKLSIISISVLRARNFMLSKDNSVKIWGWHIYLCFFLMMRLHVYSSFV